MRNRGVTLFIAIVIMSILLFISFAAVNIALKSTLFASSGRDSQYAFYAADAGIECAIYWDSKPITGSAFATSTSGGAGSPISCAGSSLFNGLAISGTTTTTLIGGIDNTLIGGTNVNPTSAFGFVMNKGLVENQVPYCAIVTVTKYYVGTRLWTYINSRGYNTCDTSNLRRVERGVEARY